MTSTLELPPADVETLRRLGEEIAAIARLPVHAEKAGMWRRLNDLEPVRPMVWINEIPWHEMNVGDELTLSCTDEWARDLEQSLRRTLYQWRHMPADMIVNEYLECPLAVESTGLGFSEVVDVAKTDDLNPIVSRHFHIQIREPEDIRIIRDPVVTHDQARTDLVFQTMRRIFADVIEVRKTGRRHFWFSPWDYLIRAWGVQEAMIDLIDRPGMVNAFVSRYVEASLKEVDQYERLNLLALGSNNTRVGSGGYGYTGLLPAAGFDPGRVRPADMWGCSNAQIFSEISPEMHWEFAIRHDLPWLDRWGLNYYGCCEPLDGKLEILRRIPRLRKISMSPWVRLERAARVVGTDFVFSRKPNPAVLAEHDWRPQRARAELARGPGEDAGPRRRAHHEGHLDSPLPAAAPVGVAADRHGRSGALRAALTPLPARFPAAGSDRAAHGGSPEMLRSCEKASRGDAAQKGEGP